mmetsp:Transcript_8263/g.30664  ORF Transcript_8263/g.30664 Transcript_8263/m.30664 type:complete len:87 (-) Transcript_8263:78-338(-)
MAREKKVNEALRPRRSTRARTQRTASHIDVLCLTARTTKQSERREREVLKRERRIKENVPRGEVGPGVNSLVTTPKLVRRVLCGLT